MNDTEVRIRDMDLREFPPDFSYWARDEKGNIVLSWQDSHGLFDFTNPVVLATIMAEVRAIAECGLYDGVFFDHWNDGDTP